MGGVEKEKKKKRKALRGGRTHNLQIRSLTRYHCASRAADISTRIDCCYIWQSNITVLFRLKICRLRGPQRFYSILALN